MKYVFLSLFKPFQTRLCQVRQQEGTGLIFSLSDHLGTTTSGCFPPPHILTICCDRSKLFEAPSSPATTG